MFEVVVVIGLALGAFVVWYYVIEGGSRERALRNAPYECPPGLSQEQQAAWVRSVWEIECPGSTLYLPPYHRMRGLQTFTCTLCGREPTYTLACGLCQVDRGQALRPEQA